MFKFKKKQNSHDARLLLDNNDDDDVAINSSHDHNSVKRRKINQDDHLHDVSNRAMIDENERMDVDGNAKHRRSRCCTCCSFCSWKCVCLPFTILTVVALIIILLVGYISIAPKFVQSVFDHAEMNVINGTISDPTNSSITFKATIVISDAGMFDGELHTVTVDVLNDDVKIGVMAMPTLRTKANQNNVYDIETTLQISNVTQFRIFTKRLVRNMDQTWRLSADTVTLGVHLGPLGTVNYKVAMHKDLVLPGVTLYDFVSSQFDVFDATNDTVRALSRLDFVVRGVFTFVLPDTLMSIYFNGTYIGYAPLHSLRMQPGLNTITQQNMIIESSANLDNRDLLSVFFGTYMVGETQRVEMRGPVAGTKDNVSFVETVLDGVLDSSVITLGYDNGAIAFGGLVTSATLNGWTVSTTGEKIRGAYANFLNPLNVSIQITNLSATASLNEPIRWHVNMLRPFLEYTCNASLYAHLSIGEGIYAKRPNQTWIDVGPYGKTTYFSIANQATKSNHDACFDLYGFDCCFATLTTAYACYLNPGIRDDPKTGELSMGYMPLSLDANITMLIGQRFAINITYQQPFFPLYFGHEVYAGWSGDVEVSCKDITFL